MSPDIRPRSLRLPPWSYTRLLLLPALALVALFLQPWAKPSQVLADPVQWIQHRPEFRGVEDGPPFFLGLLSTTGGLIWWTGAVACLFAGYLLRGLRGAAARRDGAFLLSAGAFTALMGLDDLLLIHDGYLAHFQVPDAVTLGAYGLFFLAHCVVFRREILASESGLLLVGLVLLGGSAGIDVLAPENKFWGSTEDSLKFLGLCAWAAYHVRLSWAHVRARLGQGDGVPTDDDGSGQGGLAARAAGLGARVASGLGRGVTR